MAPLVPVNGWNAAPLKPSTSPIQKPPSTPPTPVKGEKGDKGDPGPAGPPGPVAEIDYDRLASAVASKLPKPPSVEEIAQVVLTKLPQPKGCDCPPPSTPSTNQHLVIVADKGASYWGRLSGEVKQAQDVYRGIDVAAPPAHFTGTLPQAVLYENSIPRVIGVGANQVSTVLSRIVRGDSL